jgi:hypothetical protein
MTSHSVVRAGATVVLSSVPLDLVLVAQRSPVLVVAVLLAQVVLVLGGGWLLLGRERQRQLAAGLLLRQSGLDEVRIELGPDGRVVVHRHHPRQQRDRDQMRLEGESGAVRGLRSTQDSPVNAELNVSDYSPASAASA